MPADLVARARELGAPMNAPEPGIARRSELLLKLADRVEELTTVLRELEWAKRYYGITTKVRCRWCESDRELGHAPGCRLARALGKEASDGSA